VVTLAVTGATGELGGRVARRLAGRGVAQRLVVRDPARAPALPGAEVAQATYGNGEAMRRALDGVATMLLVSASEDADRVRLHTTAVDAAVAAGVERVLYLSFLACGPDATFTVARDHWHTEQHLRASGVRHTFLRDSLYLDYFPLFVGADGVIRGPAGDGRVAGVARDDVADVVVAVLLGDGHDGRSYDVTGPEAFSFQQAAEELSRATGRAVAYHPEALEEAYASRASYGAPHWEVTGWVTTYAAVAAGELDVVGDTVDTVAGHPPMGLAEFLRRNPASYAHLVQG
jgi:NAD(P)H dehydrogenase (quinone)